MGDFPSIAEVSRRLRLGEVSPVEITQRCLERIEKLNPALNAFITVMSESALAEARRAEAEILRGEWRGGLHGVPVALKDLIDTAGVRTTAASELYKGRVPDRDAEVVRRLRQAGAVIVGKNNLHEFAYGGVRWSAILATCTIPGTWGGLRGDRRAGRRRRWWRGWLTLRLGLIRRDRFANRRRCAGAWG
jgi:Asp-tRNA(Asn)/Glu-tRNA(Gln) amidotransferase A subunit family amidase